MFQLRGKKWLEFSSRTFAQPVRAQQVRGWAKARISSIPPSGRGAPGGWLPGYIYRWFICRSFGKGAGCRGPSLLLPWGEEHVKGTRVKSGPGCHLGDEVVSFHYLWNGHQKSKHTILEIFFFKLKELIPACRLSLARAWGRRPTASRAWLIATVPYIIIIKDVLLIP